MRALIVLLAVAVLGGCAAFQPAVFDCSPYANRAACDEAYAAYVHKYETRQMIRREIRRAQMRDWIMNGGAMPL